jgi:hypothetical protein
MDLSGILNISLQLFHLVLHIVLDSFIGFDMSKGHCYLHRIAPPPAPLRFWISDFRFWILNPQSALSNLKLSGRGFFDLVFFPHDGFVSWAGVMGYRSGYPLLQSR